MIKLQLVTEPAVLDFICRQRGTCALDTTEAYLAVEDGKNVGACIFKVEPPKGDIIFADHNITADSEISDLTLRAVVDYMQRNEVLDVQNHAAFPEKVVKLVGFTASNDRQTLVLRGFKLSCGGHK